MNTVGDRHSAVVETNSNPLASRPWGALFILIGALLELGELGYARTCFDALWPSFLVAEGFSRFFVSGLSHSILRDVFSAWPLVLIGAGLAVLLAASWSESRG
jgi:hypothetical protein